MRKFFALLLTLALLLALAACGGGDTPGESTAPNQSAADPGKQATETTETQPQEVQDTPFGEYLSEEEILAMLESGDMTYWMSVDPALPEEPSLMPASPIPSSSPMAAAPRAWNIPISCPSFPRRCRRSGRKWSRP